MNQWELNNRIAAAADAIRKQMQIQKTYSDLYKVSCERAHLVQPDFQRWSNDSLLEVRAAIQGLSVRDCMKAHSIAINRMAQSGVF